MAHEPDGADEADPRSFDLAILREKLSPERYGPLVKLIDLVIAHAAVQMDLQQARYCLVQLRQVEMATSPERFGEDVNLLTESLFLNALFHYTRAVHSNPTSRLRVGVENKFTAAQKAVHRTVTQLRDRCLAHYGPGAISEEDIWIDDRVIYVPGDPQPIQYPYVRIHHQSEIDAGLMDLIDTAGPAVVAARAKLAAQLVTEIEALMSQDPHFTTLLDTCGFDVVAFHGRV